jgi:hypothetical protein
MNHPQPPQPFPNRSNPLVPAEAGTSGVRDAIRRCCNLLAHPPTSPQEGGAHARRFCLSQGGCGQPSRYSFRRSKVSPERAAVTCVTSLLQRDFVCNPSIEGGFRLSAFCPNENASPPSILDPGPGNEKPWADVWKPDRPRAPSKVRKREGVIGEQACGGLPRTAARCGRQAGRRQGIRAPDTCIIQLAGRPGKAGSGRPPSQDL